MKHVCNPGAPAQEDHEFKVSMKYIERFCSRGERERGGEEGEERRVFFKHNSFDSLGIS